MDDHVRCLIDHNQVLVFIDDLDREIFGHRFGRRRRRDMHFDDFATTELLAGLCRLPTVHCHVAGVNTLTYLGSTKPGGLGQKPVEALSGGFTGYDELHGC